MKKPFMAKRIITFLTVAVILTGMIPPAVSVSAAEDDGMYIIHTEDFENYTGTSDIFKFTFTPNSDAAAANRTGTATVEEENEENKALKVVSKMTSSEASAGGKRDNLYFIISGLPDKTGVVGISFDVFMESGHGRPFYRFGQINGSDGSGAVIYGVGTYAHAMKDADNSIKYFYFDGGAKLRFDYNLDLNNKKCKITVSNVDGTSAKSVVRDLNNYPAADGTLKLSFGQYVNSAWSVDDIGITWYDNIKVYAYGAKASSSVPKNDAANADADDGATVTYTAAVKNLNAEKIDVTANGEDVSDFSASLSSDGKTVTITPDGGLQYNTEYEIVLNDGFSERTDDKHQPPRGYTLKFKTKSIINEMANWKDSAKFGEGFKPQLTPPEGITYSAKLAKDTADAQDYTIGTAIDDAGSYVLAVEASDAEGKKQSKSWKFDVVEPTAPVANDVKIECDTAVATDSVLKGCYEYESYGDVAEGTSLFRWFRAESKSGPWNEIKGANAQTYKLNADDENMWFKFEVTPYASEEPSKGDTVTSEAFMGAMQPTASDVSVSKKGNVLTGSYTFTDLNGDEEDTEKTEFYWYKKDRKTEEVSVIEGATDKTYTLTETDIDDYIFFGVKPFSKVKPYSGEEVKSEAILLPSRPEVSNVAISGKATPGETLSAYYTFYDVNGDKEGDSVVNWYVDGNFKKTGASLDVYDSMAGDKIYFEITPYADAFPYEGETIKSDTVKVSSKKKSSGGSGTSSMKASVTVKNDSGAAKGEDTETNNQNTLNGGFADTVGHWAKSEIDRMKEKGIINGVSDTEFRPDAFVSRAEAAKLLAKAFNLSGSENIGFTDVQAEAWFAESVAAVSEAGLMRGDGGSFYPDKSMTREEICVILANIAEKYGLQGEDSAEEFADNDEISEWAREAVKTVVGLGLMNGVGEGKFAPHRETTRAEIAVILHRTLEKLGL